MVGIGRLLHHDRQAVDDDALLQRGIAGDDDRGAVVVRTIAGNIDHAPDAPMRVLVEQLHGEIDRARDRGARRPADRRPHDFIGDGVGRFRAVDQPPRNDDFLVGGSRPLEIGHRDLAVRAVLQRLQKFLGDDGLRVALALQREFVHVHRVGDIDGENEFDVDGRMWLPCRRIDGPAEHSAGCLAGSLGPARQHPRRRRRRVRPLSSTAPIETYQRIAALPSNEDDGDTQIAPRKALKSLVLHIRVSAAHEQQAIRSAPPVRHFQVTNCL